MNTFQVKYFPTGSDNAKWHVQFRDGVPNAYRIVLKGDFEGPLHGPLHCQNGEVEASLEEVREFVSQLGEPCWEGAPFQS